MKKSNCYVIIFTRKKKRLKHTCNFNIIMRKLHEILIFHANFNRQLIVKISIKQLDELCRNESKLVYFCVESTMHRDSIGSIGKGTRACDPNLEWESASVPWEKMLETSIYWKTVFKLRGESQTCFYSARLQVVAFITVSTWCHLGFGSETARRQHCMLTGDSML